LSQKPETKLVILLAILSVFTILAATSGTTGHFSPSHPHAGDTFRKDTRTIPPVQNITFEKEHMGRMIARLGQLGVDVSEPVAEIHAGNFSAARLWLWSYKQASPTPLFNCSRPMGAGWGTGRGIAETRPSLMNRSYSSDLRQQEDREPAFIFRHDENGANATRAGTETAGNKTAGAGSWEISPVFRHQTNATQDGVRVPGG
jgi:hypothetical protein